MDLRRLEGEVYIVPFKRVRGESE